ncbi:ABC transporter ATP-binding protein [Bordetella avium]|uniref:ABC transporter, ATP-binding protein n=1 Tax=Bordetella avium (strain 197N) TaxID=360910 RepID=Q2KWY8_BORA1|nr:ABC transporter ATP-binding protein [Bordetella avium]RIQ48920.1 ABC transporter ATP-binding protein [Bordetella avium]RIQ74845.1 ABC transporter ATP-binding protein [Bordetella avium]CAJ48352.1 ABC transporter, ATP-binding protein [Bordetella avium 197N]
MSVTPKLQVRHISKRFQGEQGAVQVLDDISLDAGSGEFVSIIGPSGCGKSTLFNILTGLLDPDAGSILLDGKPVADLRGRVGYMLQRDLLMPWRTVLDNVIVGLELRGAPRAESVERARHYLHAFGLLQFEDSYPKALSGGMRQRVALARTLLPDPDVLLLDEPFSALDYQTRLFLETMLADTASKQGKTVVLVTHDIDEAIALSQRIFVLSARPGRLKRVHDIRLGEPASPLAARRHPGFSTYFDTLCQELDIQTGQAEAA